MLRRKHRGTNYFIAALIKCMDLGFLKYLGGGLRFDTTTVVGGTDPERYSRTAHCFSCIAIQHRRCITLSFFSLVRGNINGPPFPRPAGYAQLDSARMHHLQQAHCEQSSGSSRQQAPLMRDQIVSTKFVPKISDLRFGRPSWSRQMW